MRVFNPTDRPVQLDDDGHMLDGAASADVDATDYVTAAVEGGHLVAVPPAPHTDPPPPRTGAGSSREAWVAYAKNVGVRFDDSVTRDEIIDTLDGMRLTDNAQTTTDEE